ncbi:Protein BCCIP-like protein [Bienertia sinuspersici]
MPRKPRSSGQLAPRPFAFSPFARSVNRVAAASSSKHKISNSKSDRTSSSKLLGSLLLCVFSQWTSKHRFRDNGPESESSEEEAPESSFYGSSFGIFCTGSCPGRLAFFDPKPGDFHGVKMLLQSYLDDKEWDLSSFVNLILAQTTVGTVVKIEEDEDEGLFAVLTALNLGRYKDNKCVTEVKDYLLKVCEENLRCKLKRLLEEQAEHVGLVPTEDLRQSFHFKHFLLVTRIYKKIAQNKKGSTRSNDEDIIYVKPEDELFFELCSWSYTFPLHIQPTTTHEVSLIIP